MAPEISDVRSFSDVASPAFVLDEALLATNMQKARALRDASGATMLLALKGFALPAAFGLMRDVLAGVTASSLNEALLGKREFGKAVHVYAPAYADDEINELLELGSHITFNSLSQWKRFGEKASAKHVSAGLRINPQYSPVETDLYNPCVLGSRLGVTRTMLGAELPVGVQGFHCHNLCESNHEALELSLAAIETHFGDLLPHVHWLNLGGGHLFSREGYDIARAAQAIAAFRSRHPNLELILEPGAAYVWRSGHLVSTVLDINQTDEGDIVMLDVSFAAHMPDCLEMPYLPAVIGADKSGQGSYRYKLGGGTCLAGDQMGPYGFERELKIGDRIVFEDMMHYTFVKTTQFNGVRHPSLMLRRLDGSLELVKKFGYEDYRAQFCGV